MLNTSVLKKILRQIGFSISCGYCNSEKLVEIILNCGHIICSECKKKCNKCAVCQNDIERTKQHSKSVSFVEDLVGQLRNVLEPKLSSSDGELSEDDQRWIMRKFNKKNNEKEKKYEETKEIDKGALDRETLVLRTSVGSDRVKLNNMQSNGHRSSVGSDVYVTVGEPSVPSLNLSRNTKLLVKKNGYKLDQSNSIQLIFRDNVSSNNQFPLNRTPSNGLQCKVDGYEECTSTDTLKRKFIKVESSSECDESFPSRAKKHIASEVQVCDRNTKDAKSSLPKLRKSMNMINIADEDELVKRYLGHERNVKCINGRDNFSILEIEDANESSSSSPDSLYHSQTNKAKHTSNSKVLPEGRTKRGDGGKPSKKARQLKLQTLCNSEHQPSCQVVNVIVSSEDELESSEMFTLEKINGSSGMNLDMDGDELVNTYVNIYKDKSETKKTNKRKESLVRSCLKTTKPPKLTSFHETPSSPKKNQSAAKTSLSAEFQNLHSMKELPHKGPSINVNNLKNINLFSNQLRIKECKVMLDKEEVTSLSSKTNNPFSEKVKLFRSTNLTDSENPSDYLADEKRLHSCQRKKYNTKRKLNILRERSSPLWTNQQNKFFGFTDADVLSSSMQQMMFILDSHKFSGVHVMTTSFTFGMKELTLTNVLGNQNEDTFVELRTSKSFSTLGIQTEEYFTTPKHMARTISPVTMSEKASIDASVILSNCSTIDMANIVTSTPVQRNIITPVSRRKLAFKTPLSALRESPEQSECYSAGKLSEYRDSKSLSDEELQTVGLEIGNRQETKRTSLPPYSVKNSSLKAPRLLNFSEKEASGTISCAEFQRRDQGARPITLTTCCLNSSELTLVAKLAQLSKSSFTKDFSHETTHLVIGEGGRGSLEYLLAIAYRAYIVTIDWVGKCIESQSILPESEYIPKTDEGPTRCLESISPPFAGYYICPKLAFTFTDYPLNEVTKTLCTLGGAKVLLEIANFRSLIPEMSFPRFFIFENNSQLTEPVVELCKKLQVVPLNYKWVLDSMSVFSTVPVFDYLGVQLDSDTLMTKYKLPTKLTLPSMMKSSPS